MIDLDELLAETAEGPPVGRDLEYDADFLALDQAARAKPEQQFGNTVIRAEEPDWPDVRSRAAALLRRTKDVRVAVLLTRALLHTEQFPGLAAGLQLVYRLLERYWDGIHPRLDAEDGNDPMTRLNALAPLVDGEALLRDVRNCWFIDSRAHGRIAVRDVEVALGKLPPKPDGTSLSLEQIQAVVREVAAADASFIQTVADASQSVRSLSELLIDRVGSEQATDLRPLGAMIGALEQVCWSAGVAAVPLDEAAAPDMPGEAERALAAAAPISGEIRSRQDAIMMLEKVCDYLERNEPTNPAPLLIRRAKRLMTKNFVEIIRDLVPDSVSQVEHIAGLKEE